MASPKDPEIPDELRRATKENADKIADSNVFLTIFNKSMIEEVIPLIQMGLAVYLNKPILVIVPESQFDAIPHNLLAMARGIEKFPDGDMDALYAAMNRLLESVPELQRSK